MGRRKALMQVAWVGTWVQTQRAWVGTRVEVVGPLALGRHTGRCKTLKLGGDLGANAARMGWHLG